MKTVNKTLIFSFIFFSFISDNQLPEEYTVPIAASSVCISDIDQDGDNDVLVGNGYSYRTGWGGISILLNDGKGSFILTDSVYVYSSMPNLQTFNANNNSFPDLVINGPEYYLWVYYDFGKTTTKYDSLLINEEYGFPNLISNGDINGDGWQDIVVGSNWGRFWGILFNLKGNGFSVPEYHFLDEPILDIACAQFTGNGADEILYTLGNYTINLYSYEDNRTYTIDSTISGKIKATDFDADGKMDVICKTYAPGMGYTILEFYKNLDDNQFENLPFFLTSPVFSDWEIADINNDQLPDLVFSAPDTMITPGPDTLYYLPGEPLITGYLINRFFVFYNRGNFQLSVPDTVYIRDKHPLDGIYTNNYLACNDISGDEFADLVFVRGIGVSIPNLVVLYNNGSGKINGEVLPTDIKEQQEIQEQGLTCYPNPFTNQTTITFRLQTSSEVSLNILDISGKTIKQIINHQTLKGGNHEYKWNGVDNSSSRCNPGPYLVYLTINLQTPKVFKLMKY